MTPKEMQIALDTFRQEVGPNADITVYLQDSLRDNNFPIRAVIYPRGVCDQSQGRVGIDAIDFEDALAKLRAGWAEHSAQFRVKTIRKMALAIIRITNEQGNCTDAALRGGDDKFTEDDVRRYGAEACVAADVMADKGPFAIVTLGGANGAPDEIPEGATVN